MRMNDIYATMGVEINECHAAHNGNPRWGVIRKEMKIWSPSDWGSSNYAIVGVEIDTWKNTIAVHFLKGSMPLAKELFWALLADRDVRRLIKEYQKKPRVKQYKIWNSIGMSNREDIFMTFGTKKGGFALTKTIKLVHISGYDRLNEGFGNENSEMYIGDFVELVSFMGLVDTMDVKTLRKRAKVKYVRPKFSEEIDYGFTTNVTKIL